MSQRKAHPHEWLFSHPRSIPGDNTAYWPDTCFLEVPDLPVDPEELRRSQGDEQLTRVEEYYALLAHEHTHWIQATACGYGRFQASIDQARTEILESFWLLCSADDRHERLAERARGRTVFQVGNDQLPRPPTGVGAVAVRLFRHWWALGSLRYQFDRTAPAIDTLLSSRFRFGLSALYAHAGPEISAVALLRDDDLRDAALAFAPPEELSQQSSVPTLDSAAIAECAAVLNQHWLYAYNAEWSRRHTSQEASDRWRSILVHSWETKSSTFYGAAFRAFSTFNPSLDLNEPMPLATLNVVCFLALDGAFPTERRFAATSWAAVFPPLRFAALSQAIRSVGLLPAHSVCALSPDDYHRYVTRLCDAAGLPLPQRYAGDSPGRWSHTPVNDLRHLHHDAALAASTVLERLPAALVAPAEASVYLEEALLDSCLIPFGLAMQAPLLIIGGRPSHMGIDSVRFGHLAVAGLYQRLMFNLFAECGPPRSDGRPRDERGRALIELAAQMVERRVGLRSRDDG